MTPTGSERLSASMEPGRIFLREAIGKRRRRLATRYDKLAANYLAFVQLASIRLWLRVNEFTTFRFKARSASSCCERSVRLRAARNMPPVISTIVMLRLFARRQRASMSAYFTNSLTPPTGFGLLTSLRGGFSHRSGSAWPGRSQKDGLPSARGESIVSGSRPSTRAQRRGQP
jgi:hypothetical protein